MNGDEQHIEDAVRRAIAEFRGMAPQELGLQARLGEDLGVDGDDAAELLSMIASRFKVDFSQLHFDRHFGPEGVSILRAIKETIEPWQSYPLTVQDLVDSVRSGIFVYDYEHRPFVPRRPWHVWIMLSVGAAIIVAVMSLFR